LQQRCRFEPHPAFSKGEGSEENEAQVLSFGEDLGEAITQPTNQIQ